MSSPRERLSLLVSSYEPSRYKLNATVQDGKLKLSARKTHSSCSSMESDPLYEALNGWFQESFNNETWQVSISVSPDSLYYQMLSTVQHSYMCNADIGLATKRKTKAFLSSVKLDDVHLANFVISSFLTISNDFVEMSSENRSEFFKPFESMRKAYGKVK